MPLFFKRSKRLIIYCDGGIGDRGEGAGLGVVIRDEGGDILGLVKRKLEPMTNNEAEYAALILALKEDNIRFYVLSKQDFKKRRVWGVERTEVGVRPWYLVGGGTGNEP